MQRGNTFRELVPQGVDVSAHGLPLSNVVGLDALACELRRPSVRLCLCAETRARANFATSSSACMWSVSVNGSSTGVLHIQVP